MVLSPRLSSFVAAGRAGRKLVVVTAYDVWQSRLVEASGADLILVGDSLGNVEQGLDSTSGVTLDQMVYHTRMVSRGRRQVPIVADLPLHSYDDPASARESSKLLMASGADAVKFEGNPPGVAAAILGAGIPVMGHLGLLPQTAADFKVRGKDAVEAARIVVDRPGPGRGGVLRRGPRMRSPVPRPGSDPPVRHSHHRHRRRARHLGPSSRFSGPAGPVRREEGQVRPRRVHQRRPGHPRRPGGVGLGREVREIPFRRGELPLTRPTFWPTSKPGSPPTGRSRRGGCWGPCARCPIPWRSGRFNGSSRPTSATKGWCPLWRRWNARPRRSSPGGGGRPAASGRIVSGGTEANVMALWTAKALAGPGRTEVVVPASAHYSFDKAASLMGLTLVKAPAGTDGRLDPAGAEAALTGRTCALVGVAGSTALGAVDDVFALAEVARRRNVYFHLDASVRRLRAPLSGRSGIPRAAVRVARGPVVPFGRPAQNGTGTGALGPGALEGRGNGRDLGGGGGLSFRGAAAAEYPGRHPVGGLGGGGLDGAAVSGPPGVCRGRQDGHGHDPVPHRGRSRPWQGPSRCTIRRL